MKALQNLRNLIFIDLETASRTSSFEEMSEPLQELWVKKAMHISHDPEHSAQELYLEKAGIYAEFGKIICVSIGILYHNESNELSMRVKSLSSHDEKELLEQLIDLLKSKFDDSKIQLCAHNGKEFDFPYLSRRMLINGISLPPYLELTGKKPWEVQHLDTMQMWKFGDWKSYTALDLLAAVFNIPSPKGDIDGSEVNKVYYEDNDLPRIARYCNRDVVTTIQVFLKLKGLEVVSDENIETLE